MPGAPATAASWAPPPAGFGEAGAAGVAGPDAPVEAEQANVVVAMRTADIADLNSGFPVPPMVRSLCEEGPCIGQAATAFRGLCRRRGLQAGPYHRTVAIIDDKERNPFEGDSPMAVDLLDARLIALLTAEPRLGVLECSRRLRVARGTVQARLNRLMASGVITGFGPQVDPAALGYPVTAFVTLQIRQVSGHDPVADRLALIPEVLEAHTITGTGDMLCRVVARSNADLQRVIDEIVGIEGVVRTSSVIALDTPVSYRVLPLVTAQAAAVGKGGQDKGHGKGHGKGQGKGQGKDLAKSSK
jgi:DNA-binding Lrp family transcriptional regulator